MRNLQEPSSEHPALIRPRLGELTLLWLGLLAIIFVSIPKQASALVLTGSQSASSIESYFFYLFAHMGTAWALSVLGAWIALSSPYRLFRIVIGCSVWFVGIALASTRLNLPFVREFAFHSLAPIVLVPCLSMHLIPGWRGRAALPPERFQFSIGSLLVLTLLAAFWIAMRIRLSQGTNSVPLQQLLVAPIAILLLSATLFPVILLSQQAGLKRHLAAWGALLIIHPGILTIACLTSPAEQRIAIAKLMLAAYVPFVMIFLITTGLGRLDAARAPAAESSGTESSELPST